VTAAGEPDAAGARYRCGLFFAGTVMRLAALFVAAIISAAGSAACAQSPDSRTQPCPGTPSATTGAAAGIKGSNPADLPGRKPQLTPRTAVPGAGSHDAASASAENANPPGDIANSECPTAPDKLDSPRQQQ
jgi:hypothetical protein